MAGRLAQHITELRLTSYVLGAISVIFGTKVLGRIPALAKPGGLYSSVLVAVPAGVLLGVLAYCGDVLSNHFIIDSINRAFFLSLTPIQYAVASGILLGVVPAFSLPQAYRWREVQRRARERLRMEHFPTLDEVIAIGLNEFILLTFGFAYAAQYVFVVLGWFNGVAIPPLLVIAVALLFAAFQMVQAYFDPRAKQMVVQNRPFVDKLDRLTDDELSAYVKRAKGAMWMAGFGLITGALDLLISIPIIVAWVAASIYLAHTLGWITIVSSLIWIGGLATLYILRALADKVPTKALIGVLVTIPGASAAILNYIIDHNDLLPR